jgi:hypothetical protein
MESFNKLQFVTSSFVNGTSIQNKETVDEINFLKQELAAKPKKARK